MESAQRLAFADVLRGLASLTVAVGHLTILPLVAPELIATFIAGVPDKKVEFPAWLDWAIVNINPPWIGVAAFFLISGFVIPMSLAGSSTSAYLLKRFFRIYPPAWVGVALVAAAISISAAYWSKTSAFAFGDFLASGFLVQDLFIRLDVFTVGWTLQIEVKFYLLAILVYMALRRGYVWPLYLFGTAIAAVYAIAAASCGSGVTALCWDHVRITPRFLFWEAMYITYMLIGSVIYAHFRKLISTRHAVCGSLFLFACFQVDLLWSPLPFLNRNAHLPYLWGLLIFVGCYCLRDRIRLTQPFKFLADISYPLYLVHPIPGYVIIRLLMAEGAPFWVAWSAAMTFAIVMSAVIHAYVEAPAITLSKRLTARWRKSPDPSRFEGDAAPVRL